MMRVILPLSPEKRLCKYTKIEILVLFAHDRKVWLKSDSLSKCISKASYSQCGKLKIGEIESRLSELIWDQSLSPAFRLIIARTGK